MLIFFCFFWDRSIFKRCSGLAARISSGIEFKERRSSMINGFLSLLADFLLSSRERSRIASVSD